MLNLLKKTTPWMVASLFVATSVFAQDSGAAKPGAPKSENGKSCKPECAPKPKCAPCPQPCPPTQMCPQPPATCCPPWPQPVLNAAYNYPARTQVRCPWDVFFDVSFIYWQPLEENLELGLADEGTTPTAASGIVGSMINQNFNYKPGFKIGLGYDLDYDNWDLHGEYTWFHNSTSTSSSAPSAGQIYLTQGTPSATYGGTGAASGVSQTWKLHMDLAEVDFGRWYYVGTKLTFRPNFGARAAWIRQNLNTVYDVSTNDVTIVQKSQSWGVGLKAGLDTNWMLGAGFRMFASGQGDLLYTKYTRLSTNQYSETTGASNRTFHVKQRSVYAVKPHLDLELGFGWGTYLDCNNWYMDFALGYGFQVFFDQNLFRNWTNYGTSSLNYAHSNLPNGNLYVQGLTATFRLDF